MRTEVTRSPYCGLPVSRCWTQQEAFQDQTLALACHRAAWCKESRGLRARCQTSEGTRGRSVIRPYGLC